MRQSRVLRQARAALRKFAEDAGGRWVTINGRHVLVKEGESPKEALDRSLKWDGDKADKDAVGGGRVLNAVVAQQGADLADDAARAGYKYDQANAEQVRLGGLLSRGKKFVSRGGPRVRDALEKANVEYKRALAADRASDAALRAFEKQHGVSGISTWEAVHGKRWPHYRVDSGAGNTAPKVLIKKGVGGQEE